MSNSDTYSILRQMLGYIDDQQLHHECHLISVTWNSSELIDILSMSMFNGVMRCMPILHNGLQVDGSVHK
jgi:hypothetical protein